MMSSSSRPLSTMIVCVCQRVSDRDIHRAAADGVHCFEDLQRATGVSTCCGRCEDCARETLDAAVAACAARRVIVVPVLGATALTWPRPGAAALA
jgi:bacterioferritin-associated ferredoxin